MTATIQNEPSRLPWRHVPSAPRSVFGRIADLGERPAGEASGLAEMAAFATAAGGVYDPERGVVFGAAPKAPAAPRREAVTPSAVALEVYEAARRARLAHDPALASFLELAEGATSADLADLAALAAATWSAPPAPVAAALAALREARRAERRAPKPRAPKAPKVAAPAEPAAPLTPEAEAFARFGRIPAFAQAFTRRGALKAGWSLVRGVPCWEG